MSEYQYYEFLAIDRPLDSSEMDALRGLSSRAEISSTRFQNTYNFGNFKGAPDRMMEAFFDAHVYVANWGTQRLMLRFPKGVVDEDVLIQYSVEEVLSFRYADDHLILEWVRSDEPQDDWVEGEGWMARLIPIRDEIERGDYRALYLGWLSGASTDNVPEDEEEPPVPAGLGSLSAAQSSLVEFLGIDADFLSAAALASPFPSEPSESERKMSEWVAGISEVKARDYLLPLLQGKSREAERNIRRDFAAYLRDHDRTEKNASPSSKRSAAELLEEVGRARETRLKREKREKQRKAEERRKQRERYLGELAKDFGLHWKKAHELAERGIASAYDSALTLLADLSEAYALERKQREFSGEMAGFRATHSRRGALIRRLNEAGLK